MYNEVNNLLYKIALQTVAAWENASLLVPCTTAAVMGHVPSSAPGLQGIH